MIGSSGRKGTFVLCACRRRVCTEPTQVDRKPLNQLRLAELISVCEGFLDACEGHTILSGTFPSAKNDSSSIEKDADCRAEWGTGLEVNMSLGVRYK